MHELPFAKSIYNCVVEAAEQNGAKAVLSVSLEVGELRDFIPELVQKYWDYISKGGIAEGSKVKMTIVPASVRCRDCGTVYPVDLSHLTSAMTSCPQCKSRSADIETGRELKVLDIEIE